MRNLKIRAVGFTSACLMVCAAMVPGYAQAAQDPPQPPPTQQAAMDEFVPMSEMTDREVLPAAPLVFYAYGFVFVVLLGYLWAIWRRVGQVQLDLDAVRRRLDERNAGPAARDGR
jgi:hypothetical protein